MMSQHWRIPIVALAVLITIGTAAADDFVHEEFRIPMAAAGPKGLEAVLVRPRGSGRSPLALINHGSPRSEADRPGMTPLGMAPVAQEFARRGWAAVVVMRRGFGGSGGDFMEGFGSCDSPDYVRAGTTAAADLRAAIAYLSNRSDIDASRIISAGVSAGGLATVALTADPPPGLIAGINFAGGKGSQAVDTVCRSEKLVEAYATFGKRSRLPMLWVYAENDHFFGPALAKRFNEAFVGAGGRTTFIMEPPFGTDGHALFSAAGISRWTPLVDNFLRSQNLVFGQTPLASAGSQLEMPRELGESGRKAFSDYLAGAPHKAFAVSPDGYFGWKTGKRTVEEAKSGALEFCKGQCRIVAVDDDMAR
jgi:dienelactone hydrolase